ncbi:hypothetical protein EVAR_13707_1 [Eumeta japonica]|uniref:Uncharacterized protein n=1 Tax=Eumeta variegata TaxID=151549 RepID=A0A4C1UBG4_EUMVA|nr:hypothetical protein EVAR_13707_1 [Eumeta japonica]
MRLLNSVNIDSMLLRTELPSQRTQRLAAVRERKYKRLTVESEEQRQTRWANVRETRRRNRFLGKDEFISAIDVSADVSCSICKQLFYPKQRRNLQTSFQQDFLPSELVEMNKILTCSRSSANIRKLKVPSQAY